MNRQHAISILLSLALLSCMRTPQREVRTAVEPWQREAIPALYDNDSLRTAYLYTEGVKVAATTEQPQAALPYYREILSIDSLHAPAHFRLGEIYSHNDPKLSLYHSERALRGDSTNIDYLTQHSIALVACGEIEKARLNYDKILLREKNNPYYYRAAAVLYAASGMPHMAISLLDSAEYRLGHIEALANYKRELLIKVGQYDRAIEETRSAVANNPFEVENHLTLAGLYATIGRDSLAEASYLEAHKIAPQNPTTLFAMADYYDRRGKNEKFLATVKEIFLNDEVALKDKLQLYDNNIIADESFYRRNFFTINSLISILYVKYPDSYDCSSRYATHLIRAGELEKSLAHFKRLAADPANPKEALYTVIDMESYLGHRDSLAHYLNVAIERYPSEVYPYMRAGYEALKEGDEKGEKLAAKYFKRAADITTDSLEKSNAYAALGDLHNTDKRYRYYRKALEWNPRNAMVLNNWAWHLSQEGRTLPFALEMSTRACELEPTNATYLDTKGWILFLVGDLQEAKRIMRQAISLDTSGDSTLLLHYADILAAEGEHFMAELYYKRALEAGEPKEIIEQRLEGLKQ